MAVISVQRKNFHSLFSWVVAFLSSMTADFVVSWLSSVAGLVANAYSAFLYDLSSVT